TKRRSVICIEYCVRRNPLSITFINGITDMKLLTNTVGLVLIVLLASLAAAQLAEKKDGELKFEPFTIPFEGQNVAAELGRLTVRENRSNPTTKLIELAFV